MLQRKVVAIHQPNFFPWLGYFEKMARSDVFILMDNAQFEKKGGNWGNRVRIIVKGQPVWLIVPVARNYHGMRRIYDIYFSNETPWRRKLLKTIYVNYAGAPFYEEICPFITELINYPVDRLAEYNAFSIKAVANALGLDTGILVNGSTLSLEHNTMDLLMSKTYSQSDVNYRSLANKQLNKRVIAMVKSVGGTVFLSGGAATPWIDEGMFMMEGVEVVYQNFQHPIYPQTGAPDFFPGLSIVDVLMNCGIQGTRSLLGTGER
jgi:hypothetical protein